MPRVDYDRIAHLYDEPLRDHVADAQLLAILARRPDLGPSTIRALDIGCGTGKQLAANRATLSAAILVGVDRFRGMLDIARRRGPDVAWVQGDGCLLPFRTASFDYVTSQFAYQHFGEPVRFICEVFRVLRPGGRFVMTNIDPWGMTDWTIYRYFPEARDRDLLDFLPAEDFQAAMRAAGFVNVEVERRQWRAEQHLADFLVYVSERHRTSQLMVISDGAYRAGLERLRQAVAASGAGSPTGETETCLLTISGEVRR